MNKTKITAKIFLPLIKNFNEQLSALHIKRDSFLNSMLQSEIKYLAAEMEGKKLSKNAKKYIAGELKRMGKDRLETVNIVVDKDVADALNKIVESSNLVRDAFINRLILLLRSSDEFLNLMELPTSLTASEFDAAEYMPCSPLKTIESVMSNPLYYLRIASEERFGKGLYELELPSALMGFSCYIEDDLVPGTVAYKEQLKNSEELLKELLTLESGSATQIMEAEK